MEEASTTPPIDTPPVEQVINSDVNLPMEQTMMFGASYAPNSNYPDINLILSNYFSIFHTSYFLLVIAFGIMSVLLYTIYNYLEE